jgi:hypothetical protein
MNSFMSPKFFSILAGVAFAAAAYGQWLLAGVIIAAAALTQRRGTNVK